MVKVFKFIISVPLALIIGLVLLPVGLGIGVIVSVLLYCAVVSAAYNFALGRTSEPGVKVEYKGKRLGFIKGGRDG